MTSCVRFMDSVLEVQRKLEQEGEDLRPVWVELGPGSVLSSIVGHIFPQSHIVSSYLMYKFNAFDYSNATCLPKVDAQHPGEYLLQAIGSIWTNGISVDWSALCDESKDTSKPRVLELPSYPFQCKDFCINPKTRTIVGSPVAITSPKPTQSGQDAESVREGISEIWNNIIGQHGYGGESWFEIGGDSLNCVQLVSKIESVFGIYVSVPSIFAHPTIESQCELLMDHGLSVDTRTAPERQVQVALNNKELKYRASMQQESLYFIELLHPKGTNYLVHFAAEIAGNLSKQFLEQSFAEVVLRHSQALACYFTMDNESLMACASKTSFELYAYHDWAGQPDVPAKVRTYMHEEAKRGFDVHDPYALLLRVHLLKTSPTTHTLFVVAHHLIVDGWSLGILFQELSSIYKHLSEPSTEVTLSLPSATYSQFADWQKDRMSANSPIRQKHAKYWKEQLAGVKLLPLGDFVRPSIASTRGSRAPVVLPSTLLSRLSSVAKEAKTTMFVVLMAAYQVLLYMYSGHEDITVGTACANRLRTEWEGVIGLFTNMVVIRTPNMNSLTTFQAVLDHVKHTVIKALEHQEMPFHVVVEEVNPPRLPNVHPLFQTSFILHNERSTPSFHPEISVAPRSSWETNTDTTRFDLNLQLWPNHSGDLEGYVEYSTELFRDDTILRMVENLKCLLASVGGNWQQDLSNLEYVSPEESHKVVNTFNPIAPYPTKKCMHHLIEESVRAHLHSTALVWAPDGHTWTYEKLNRCANTIARCLLSNGASKNSRVGLVFERSPLAIASMLGIWKAGATYVPINPEAAKAQFLHILEDAEIHILLVHTATESIVTSLCQGKNVAVINTDRLFDKEFTSQDDVAPSVTSCHTDLAYIIFTSGSTGKPKGVCIEHEGICNHVHGVTHTTWKLTETDHQLQTGRYFFDFCVAEIFAPLYCGATLVLAEQSELLPGPQFVSLLKRLDITTMKILPSALNSLDDATFHPSQLLPKLRLIVCAGEPLSYHTIHNWVTPSRTLINSYGPTEASVSSNNFCIEYSDLARLDPREQLSVVPIGPPIPNYKEFVLHPTTLQILPIGAVGEIFIGGICVARGYINILFFNSQ